MAHTAQQQSLKAPHTPVRASRVLVLSAHAGGVDRRIVGECNALADSGREVTLLSLPAEIDKGTLHEHVCVRMPIGEDAGPPGGLIGLYKKLPPRIKRARRDVEYVLRPNVLPRCTQTLIDLAAGLDADVVHCHDAETLPAAVRIANGRIPVIYDSHELAPHLEPDPFFRAYWSRLEGSLIGECAAVITVNRGVAEAMRDAYGISIPDVVLNGCDTAGSVDVSDEAFRGRFGLGVDRRPRAIYCGTMRTDRNLQTLIAAAAHVPEADVLLLGGGPGASKLRSIARNMPNVYFGEPAPQSELIATLGHADIGVIPYAPDRCLNHKLCTPNKLFEYLEAGLVIVSNLLPEVQRLASAHGRARCADLSTPPRAAEAIREAMGLVGSKTTEPDNLSELRWPAQAERLLGVYERLGL